MIKKLKIQLTACLAVALLSSAANTAQAADHEVYASGGRYYWKTFGVVRGNSTDLKTAIAGAVSTGNRTVYLLTGGTLSGTVELPANTTLEGGDKYFSKNGGYAFHGKGSANITVRRVRVNGSSGMGMRFTACPNVKISDCSVTGAGIGIRVDSNDREPWLYWTNDLSISNCTFQYCSGHGVETYGINRYNIQNITSSDMGQCSVLINQSKSGTIGSVKGTRCSQNAGYAALRFSNNCDGCTVSSVTSTQCGRGLFILTGSKNITVNTVTIRDTAWSHDIYIQGGSNNKVNGGTYDGYNLISDSPGSYINATKVN